MCVEEEADKGPVEGYKQKRKSSQETDGGSTGVELEPRYLSIICRCERELGWCQSLIDKKRCHEVWSLSMYS